MKRFQNWDLNGWLWVLSLGVGVVSILCLFLLLFHLNQRGHQSEKMLEEWSLEDLRSEFRLRGLKCSSSLTPAIDAMAEPSHLYLMRTEQFSNLMADDAIQKGIRTDDLVRVTKYQNSRDAAQRCDESKVGSWLVRSFVFEGDPLFIQELRSCLGI
jgi:hypothetical protein